MTTKENNQKSILKSQEKKITEVREMLPMIEEEKLLWNLRYLQAREELANQNSFFRQEKEHEYLLEQKKQLEEELSRAYAELKNRTTKHKVKHNPSVAILHAWLDMRRGGTLDNWYSPEIDGTWSGPRNLSSIILPEFMLGNFRLEMEVTDAISELNESNLRIAYDGSEIPYEINQVNEDSLFPVVVIFHLDLKIKKNEFSFMVGSTKSPSDFGLDDNRILGIKVKGIHFFSI